MHINCPHCHNGIEVVKEASLTDVECPSCGSRFSLLGEDPDRTLSNAHTTRTIGRFELVNEVGVGAFGSVWRGKDPQLDRAVAVKIPRKGQLNKQESEQFFREARAAAQLKHPNIVPVHEIGKDGDTIYIVSDFVQGVSLADRLTAGPLSMRESAELCLKVCNALGHAHEKGVIHRDLKPANIMLDDQGEPHVMDFGLAKREAGEITMTVDGQILGTPAYMSPEQARGSAHNADGRSDIYAVGVILFQLLTGELPFRGNTRMLLHQVINEEAPSPLRLNSNIEKDLATITTKCLEKDADKRYQSAELFAEDLSRFLSGKPILARPVGRIEKTWRWSKRNPALASSLAATAILLLTLSIGGPLAALQQSALKKQAQTEYGLRVAADVAYKKAEEERRLARLDLDSLEVEKEKLTEDKRVLELEKDKFTVQAAMAKEEQMMAQKQLAEDRFRQNQPKSFIPNAINDAIWKRVAPPATANQPPISEFELAIMREVTIAESTGMHFNTLAVAEFRLGNFEEAIVAAEKSLELTPKEQNYSSAYPGDLAILAMSRFNLGDKEKADDYRQRLNESIDLDDFKNDRECKSFLAEVNKLFGEQE